MKYMLSAILFAWISFADAATINPSDTATACNEGFRCGLGAISPGVADYIKGIGPVEQRSAIEFSLANLDTIEKAELYLVATGFSAYPEFINDPVLEFHGYFGDGVIQYSDLFVNNLIFTTQPIDHLGLYIFDVTDFVSLALSNSKSFVGFSVRDVMPNSAVSFYGSNTLIVTAVPIPASLYLFSSALLFVWTLTRVNWTYLLNR